MVRLEDRLDAGPDDVWSALTEPARLGQWLGEVDGDLRVGGRFQGHWLASEWAGACLVQVCEPQRRLRIATSSADQPDGAVDVTLSADGGRTVTVVEDHGVPADQAAAYGAGDQIHVEDLAAHLAGRGRCDPRVRWAELHPGYQQPAAELARSQDGP